MGYHTKGEHAWDAGKLFRTRIFPAVCAAAFLAASAGLSTAPAEAVVAVSATPPTPPSEDNLNALRAQLSGVDRQLADTQNLIVSTGAMSTAAEAQVQVAETRLSQLAAEKETYRSTIANYAKNMYTSGDVASPQASLATVITGGPTGVSDLTRTEHLRDTFGGNELVKVSQLDTAMETERKTLSERKTAEENARQESAAAVKKLAELNTARADAVKKLSDETSTYTVLLAKYMCEQERYIQQQAIEKAALEAASAAEAAKAAAAAASVPNVSSSAPAASAQVAAVPAASSSNSVWNAKKLWDILIAEGFTPEAAAGILGNLQQESNINPRSIQSNGPGHGIAQWSAGGRWDTSTPNLLGFAAYTSSDPWNLVTQAQFMLVEMKMGWGGFNIETYKHMTDVVQATIYFHNKYEQSADSEAAIANVRGGYAKEWYAMFKNTVPVITVTNPNPAPAAPSAPAASSAPAAPASASQITSAGMGDSSIVLASCPL